MLATSHVLMSLKGALKQGYLNRQRRFLDLFLRRHESHLSQQEMRRGRVLVALLIFGILASSAMTVVRFATEGTTTTSVFVALGPLALVGGLVHFIRTGNSRASGDILIMVVLGIVFFTAFFDGGLYSRVLTWAPALPLIANFSASRLTPIRTTMLALAGLLFLLLCHDLQWIASERVADPLLGRLLASFGSLVFVSAIAYAYEDSRRRAEEERESLSRTRSDWVSMVSHELRTPLTSLYGGLRMMAGGHLDDQPEQRKNLLDLSTRNTERLISLVNDILDVERLNAGRLDLKFRPVQLAEVLQEAIATQRYLAESQGVSIRIDTAAVPPVQGDADRLLQVAQNLLSNAIKFSSRGGEVTVRLIDLSDRLRCEVSDQGEGVSEDFVGRLFERFAQQESGTRRHSGGSGLGLFICHGIIELHSGNIGYKPGKHGGSVFYFELPKSTSSERSLSATPES